MQWLIVILNSRHCDRKECILTNKSSADLRGKIFLDVLKIDIISRLIYIDVQVHIISTKLEVSQYTPMKAM